MTARPIRPRKVTVTLEGERVLEWLTRKAGLLPVGPYFRNHPIVGPGIYVVGVNVGFGGASLVLVVRDGFREEDLDDVVRLAARALYLLDLHAGALGSEADQLEVRVEHA